MSGHRRPRPHLRRARVLSAIVAALLALGLAGCTTHSVGPARTADDYERKARTTASEALSAVETVRLLVETSTAGKSFAVYTNVSISDQEDALAAIRGDFESIQPPGEGSDAIRDELTELLDTAVDHIATVRIAARRGGGDLAEVGAPLSGDADALDIFLESLS